MKWTIKDNNQKIETKHKIQDIEVINSIYVKKNSKTDTKFPWMIIRFICNLVESLIERRRIRGLEERISLFCIIKFRGFKIKIQWSRKHDLIITLFYFYLFVIITVDRYMDDFVSFATRNKRCYFLTLILYALCTTYKLALIL